MGCCPRALQERMWRMLRKITRSWDWTKPRIIPAATRVKVWISNLTRQTELPNRRDHNACIEPWNLFSISGSLTTTISMRTIPWGICTGTIPDSQVRTKPAVLLRALIGSSIIQSMDSQPQVNPIMDIWQPTAGTPSNRTVDTRSIDGGIEVKQPIFLSSLPLYKENLRPLSLKV